ncbi:MAG TPA: hypothetical protein VFU47_12570, partial [Armatimonadota bacterium]|nr:hypothetical protein [Armatimonadota bacterium]
WYVTAAGFRAIGRDDVAENLERALERAEAAKANGTLKAPGEVEYRAPEHVYATDREQATRDADADDEYAALPVLPTPADHARAERAPAPAREDTEGMPTDPAVLQVISLVRHGHLIRRDSDGIWRVNGGTYGLISQDRLQVAVRAALGYGVVDILPESHVKCPILVLREDRIAERKAWDRGVRPGTRVTGLTGRITYEVVRIEQGHAKCYPVYPDGADPESVRWLHLETLTPVS